MPGGSFSYTFFYGRNTFVNVTFGGEDGQGFHGFFGEDDYFQPSGFASGGSNKRLRQDPPTPLNLTLEELYQGCEKKMTISRRVLSPDGTTRQEEKVITISVKPGWKAGTKITFPQEGDQVAGKIPQDIVFVVKEKPHLDFTRVGNDLYYTAHISLKEALVGTTLSIRMIDKIVAKYQLMGDRLTPYGTGSDRPTGITSPRTEIRIPGKGMPISKTPGQYGDLVVKFDIQFPL